MEALSLDLPNEECIESSPKGYTMLAAIRKDTSQNLLVTWCPGSGKTIIAIRRFQRLLDQWKNVYMLVYNKLLSMHLESSLQEEIRTLDSFYGHINYKLEQELNWYISELSEDEIKKTFEAYVEKFGKIDAVVIDEWQDFPEKIYRNLQILFNHISVFGDDLQRINENSSSSEQIEENLDPFRIEFNRNFRNTPEIWETCKQFVPMSERVQSRATSDDLISALEGEQVLKFNDDWAEYKEPLWLVMNILDRHKDDEIGIFINTIKNIDDFSFQLWKVGEVEHAKYHSKIPDEEVQLASPFITTYKSLKGMEFDVAILFIPILKKNTFPKKEKFVAATRAKKKLYVIYTN